MASRTDAGLADAWRSLSGASGDDGWKLIKLDEVGACSLSAGRRFPGNSEALLVSFPGARVPAGRQLPHGRGFEVTKVPLGSNTEESLTLGLVREQAGSLDLFEAMAEDIIRSLERGSRASVQALLDIFLRRVAAWQDFMRRPGDQRLSPEEEVGLYGELLMLETMLEVGAPATDIVDGWEGPLDGLQDFVVGVGAIEVKATISATGFPARIASLEQLEDSERQPLYLAAQRLASVSDGAALPEIVDRLRARLSESGAAGLFELRLKQAGYRDEHAEHYVRTFAPAGERLFHVDPNFPRLTPGTVSSAIRSAVYTLELDHLEAEPTPLLTALRNLEII
jgi:hypothetical protein